MDTSISSEAKIRRKSIVVLLVLSIVLILARMWSASISSDSDWKVQLSVLLDNLSAASILALVAAVFLVLQTKHWASRQPLLIRGESLGTRLLRDAQGSRFWYLRARTGSYFVRETLPLLAKVGTVNIKAILLDLSCAESIARYENDKTSRGQTGWTAERIRADIVVSIVRISQYVLNYPNLSVEVRFSSGVWVQSLDVSEKSAFLCGQERGDRALVSPQSSELYRRFDEDFQAAFHTARRVRMPIRELCDRGFTDPKAPIDVDVMDALCDYFSSEFDFDLLDESMVSKVRERSIGDHHYARNSGLAGK